MLSPIVVAVAVVVVVLLVIDAGIIVRGAVVVVYGAGVVRLLVLGPPNRLAAYLGYDALHLVALLLVALVLIHADNVKVLGGAGCFGVGVALVVGSLSDTVLEALLLVALLLARAGNTQVLDGAGCIDGVGEVLLAVLGDVRDGDAARNLVSGSHPLTAFLLVHTNVLSAAVSAGVRDGTVEVVRALFPSAAGERPRGPWPACGCLIGDVTVESAWLVACTSLSSRLMVILFLRYLVEANAEGVPCVAGMGLGGMMDDVCTLLGRIMCCILEVTGVGRPTVESDLDMYV